MCSYPLVLIPPTHPHLECTPYSLGTFWRPHEHETNKGFSEKWFYSKYLKKFFSDKIHPGWALDFIEGLYITDFTYFDEDKNILFIVEIDEPYAAKTKKPIHYLGSEWDTKRNNWFLDFGCIVIRFSEEQVITEPEKCCREIAKVIAQVSDDQSVLEAFKEIRPLEPHAQWTKQDAIEMAALDSRREYQRQRELRDNLFQG